MSEKQEIIKQLEQKLNELEAKPVFPRIGVVYEILLAVPEIIKQQKKGQFGEYEAVTYRFHALEEGKPVILEVKEYQGKQILSAQKAQNYPSKMVWVRKQ